MMADEKKEPQLSNLALFKELDAFQFADGRLPDVRVTTEYARTMSAAIRRLLVSFRTDAVHACRGCTCVECWVQREAAGGLEQHILLGDLLDRVPHAWQGVGGLRLQSELHALARTWLDRYERAGMRDKHKAVNKAFVVLPGKYEIVGLDTKRAMSYDLDTLLGKLAEDDSLLHEVLNVTTWYVRPTTTDEDDWGTSPLHFEAGCACGPCCLMRDLVLTVDNDDSPALLERFLAAIPRQWRAAVDQQDKDVLRDVDLVDFVCDWLDNYLDSGADIKLARLVSTTTMPQTLLERVAWRSADLDLPLVHRALAHNAWQPWSPVPWYHDVPHPLFAHDSLTRLIVDYLLPSPLTSHAPCSSACRRGCWLELCDC